ncbi:DUF2538 family protein [Bacillus sp. T33-2]|uniref:DUF2538 family protein n=1 Tax=Bacillus sp. T33-2 TaxID=2054168 RepID=UPI000C7800BA|nr:DUF2538 family protein [Bacillus sp. T33-2]PLR89987.1 hypothetical protein CVD19_22675 [Bacillus sp. T33-2]
MKDRIMVIMLKEYFNEKVFLMQDCICFINEHHKLNFKQTLLKFPEAKTDPRQQTACYILAVPMIFKKVGKYLATFEYPVDWIWRWEWKYTLSNLEIFQSAPNQQEYWEPDYELTSCMIQLGKFSLNMWNGYEHFNFMDFLSELDEKHYAVFMTAISMRRGKFSEWNMDRIN